MKRKIQIFLPLIVLVSTCVLGVGGELSAVRGSILHFTSDPFFGDDAQSYQFIQDGLLVVDDGKVKDVGAYAVLAKKYPQVSADSYPDSLIIPGFVDVHIHYPQTEMIAAYGEQLLDWLKKYTFPTEAKYKDLVHARQVAAVFLKELLRNGTTTALVFGTVHPESIDAFFEESRKLNMRMIAGKVMMDRRPFAPAFLSDTAVSSYDETRALIRKWHGKGRSLYAITPRFAITSTEEQLAKAGQLKREFPGVYVQTHLSENLKEIDTVKNLFPDTKGYHGYLDVYDHFGLLGPKSVFAHCVHLTDAEFERLAQTNSAIAWCPTSNLFLGSGLFKIQHAKRVRTPGQETIRVGLGTDVGAGTSFSLLQTMNEAYKVAQLQDQKLSALKTFFLATLGGAEALSLDDKLGNFLPGKEADFVVLDLLSTPLMRFRVKDATVANDDQLAEKLFILTTLGDDRAVKATYIAGKLAYKK